MTYFTKFQLQLHDFHQGVQGGDEEKRIIQSDKYYIG